MLNNTNFGWDGYHIQVTLGGPFSLNYATAPTNWKTTITGPSAVGDGNYVGTIDYAMATGGSPVLIGQTGEFGFEMGLDGLNLYGFGLAMAPSPEPATLVLLGAGAVGLVIRRRRRK